jgi:hypothetical protein
MGASLCTHILVLVETGMCLVLRSAACHAKEILTCWFAALAATEMQLVCCSVRDRQQYRCAHASVPHASLVLSTALCCICRCKVQPGVGSSELFTASQHGFQCFKHAAAPVVLLLTAAGAVTDAVGVLLSRGQAAVEAIAAAPDPTSRRDAEAFQQLQLIRQMVELAGQGQWDKVLQVRCRSRQRSDPMLA